MSKLVFYKKLKIEFIDKLQSYKPNLSKIIFNKLYKLEYIERIVEYCPEILENDHLTPLFNALIRFIIINSMNIDLSIIITLDENIKTILDTVNGFCDPLIKSGSKY